MALIDPLCALNSQQLADGLFFQTGPDRVPAEVPVGYTHIIEAQWVCQWPYWQNGGTRTALGEVYQGTAGIAWSSRCHWCVL